MMLLSTLLSPSLCHLHPAILSLLFTIDVLFLRVSLSDSIRCLALYAGGVSMEPQCLPSQYFELTSNCTSAQGPFSPLTGGDCWVLTHKAAVYSVRGRKDLIKMFKYFHFVLHCSPTPLNIIFTPLYIVLSIIYISLLLVSLQIKALNSALTH